MFLCHAYMPLCSSVGKPDAAYVSAAAAEMQATSGLAIVRLT